MDAGNPKYPKASAYFLILLRALRVLSFYVCMIDLSDIVARTKKEKKAGGTHTVALDQSLRDILEDARRIYDGPEVAEICRRGLRMALESALKASKGKAS